MTRSSCFSTLVFGLAITTALSAQPPVSHHRATRYLPILGKFSVDLDHDSIDDLEFDLSDIYFRLDRYFLVRPLNNTAIASENGITRSFSAPTTIRPNTLSWSLAPDSLLTGGIVVDAIGNYVTDGWGGVTYDDFGNPTLPRRGPTYQIDLFLVRLTNGFAWVRLDSRNVFYLGFIDLHWGYLADAGEKFRIRIDPQSYNERNKRK